MLFHLYHFLVFFVHFLLTISSPRLSFFLSSFILSYRFSFVFFSSLLTSSALLIFLTFSPLLSYLFPHSLSPHHHSPPLPTTSSPLLSCFFLLSYPTSSFILFPPHQLSSLPLLSSPLLSLSWFLLLSTPPHLSSTFLSRLEYKRIYTTESNKREQKCLDNNDDPIEKCLFQYLGEASKKEKEH